MRSRPILRLEDKIEGERALLEGLSRPSERRWGIAAALAAMLLVPPVAHPPRPTGASPPPAGDADSGDWTTVVRGMPPPPAPAEVQQNQPAVGAGSGILILDEVQPAGKKSMSGKSFLAGARNWES